MSILIVLLPLNPGGAAEYHYATTPNGQTLSGHGSAPAALLPAAAQVVAVVPARALSWHRVDLPQGATQSDARLRAVLEGLLEDQLLDEPSQLHLAVAPGARAGESTWVAACDKAWLREALRAIETPARPVTRIVPEFAPGEAGAALAALGDPQEPWLVQVQDGVAVLPLVASALAAMPAPPDAPATAEPAVAAWAEQLLQRKVTLQQGPQRWLLSMQGAWDLAQFDLATSGQARALRRAASAWRDGLYAPRWRAARWGALLLVAANLIGLNAWAWKEHASLGEKRQAIHLLLTQTFPAVKYVTDAPAQQMQREVARLQQASGQPSGSDLEAMLSALAGSLPAGRSSTSIEFANGEAKVHGLALSAEESSQALVRMRALGYSVQTQGDALSIRAPEAP